ncbi:hypothetical protein P879_01040 [Paragonimus westermani]|uniref:Winged helix Storkhead-box1 domain-containing protein n=1 Tax=Paragonimus westermani TaxID=34504 RepID=A0A8T0DM41_9TREM|nr:hypothetical protein P879_01040 [Paragonimus westermani]
MDRTSVTLLDRTLVIMLGGNDASLTITSRNLFVSFQLVNACRYWNLNLNEALISCHLIGLIHPSSLLISGPSDQLDVIKTAWIKRLLKPPTSFTIEGVGEFPAGLQARYISQQGCISLKEAICYIIFDLSAGGSAVEPESNQLRSTMKADHVHERSLIPYPNPNQLLLKPNKCDERKRKGRKFENCSERGDNWILNNSNGYQPEDQIITFEKIYSRLATWYSGGILPSQNLILNALEELTLSGYIYQTEYGYNVMTSDKVRVARWIFDQQQRHPHRRRQQCTFNRSTTQLIAKDFNQRAAGTNSSAHEIAIDGKSTSVNSLAKNPKTEITHPLSISDSRFLVSKRLYRALYSLPRSFSTHAPRTDRLSQNSLENNKKRSRDKCRSAGLVENAQVRV